MINPEYLANAMDFADRASRSRCVDKTAKQRGGYQHARTNDIYPK